MAEEKNPVLCFARGQAVPLDFVAGLFIFIVLLVYFVIQWDIFSNRFLDAGEGGNMEMRAISIAENLVSSPGQPFNWTLSPLAAQSIGFAPVEGRLDSYRMDAFSSVPYANAKLLLGTDYDFVIKIESPDGARFATIGQEPINASRAVEVTRAAVFNGAAALVKVQLYG